MERAVGNDNEKLLGVMDEDKFGGRYESYGRLFGNKDWRLGSWLEILEILRIVGDLLLETEKFIIFEY